MRNRLVALVGCVILLGTPQDSLAQLGGTTANDASSLEALPSIAELPDLFTMSGGRHRLLSTNRGRLSVVPQARDAVCASRMAGIAAGMWEWNEALVGSLFRGLRSGDWFLGNNRQAAGHFYSNPKIELANVGFRVARPPKRD